VQSPAIPITVNGQPKTVPPDQSVAALLSCLSIAPDRVAVELNKSLVRKRDWAQTVVPSGSQIEIVEFVGGG
jgi:thiamine biosynthesis protein ThiS